jgi:hypothetical protein
LIGGTSTVIDRSDESFQFVFLEEPGAHNVAYTVCKGTTIRAKIQIEILDAIPRITVGVNCWNDSQRFPFTVLFGNHIPMSAIPLWARL